MNFWERNNADADNREYANQNGGGAADNGGKANASGFSEQEMRDRFDEYSSKSEDQLMSELAAMAARMKGDGSFDPAAIENLYNTASPFLNEAQRQRMRQIIDMLVR